MRIYPNSNINMQSSVKYLTSNPFKTVASDAFTSTRKLSYSKKSNPISAFFNKLGLRRKLKPNSFATNEKINLPYVNSKNAVKLTNDYIDNNYLYYDQKIINGFRDAGRQAEFNKFGDVIYSNREIITVDREVDLYLANAIKYTKNKTQDLNERQKAKFIYKLVQDISGNFEKSDIQADINGKIFQSKEILLGEVFQGQWATCRHKALMFKILAEEAGLNAKMIRGKAFDLAGYGPHVWNEVKFSNGEKLLIDTQNSKIINLSNQNVARNVDLAGYCTIKGKPIYNKLMGNL